MRTKHLLKLLCLVFSLVVGCAGHHQRPAHDTKLSKAMEKASDDHKENRTIETEDTEATRRHVTPWRPNAEKKPASSAPAADHSAKKRYAKAVSLNIGTGLIAGDEFYRLDHGDLALGFHINEKQRMEAFVGLGNVSFEAQPDGSDPRIID